MRRSDREVKDDGEICAIMDACPVVHLAIHAAPAPYCVPVNFGMEPDGWTLYIHSAPVGLKCDLLGQDCHVGFNMALPGALEYTGKSCSMNYSSVSGWGVAKEVRDADEKCHALERIMAHYHPGQAGFSEAMAQHTRVYRIEIQSRTAKRRAGQTQTGRLKIYGSMLCKDCVACVQALGQAGISYEFLDFSKDLQNLKVFLALREENPAFSEIRGSGKIGIPCLVMPDGTVTLEWEALGSSES